MIDFFVAKWFFLSLLVGITWVVVSTTLAEKISGRLGGLIAGLPSTGVVTFLFIGLSQGVDAVRAASISLLLMSGFYSLFFISYLLLSTRKKFAVTLVSSLVVWFLLAFLVAKIAPTNLTQSFIAWLVIITVSLTWASKNITINLDKIPKKDIKSPMWFKAVLSGLIIGCVVLISKIAGPIWGGIFATFPAVTTSTILITARFGGIEFSRLFTKHNHISITINLGLLAIFSYFLFPLFGVILGTIFSYLCLLIVGLPLYGLFNKLSQTK